MSSTLQQDLTHILGTLRTVTRGPDTLRATLEKLRHEMEIPAQPNAAPGFRSGTTGGKQISWRNGVVNTPSSSHGGQQKPTYNTRPQQTNGSQAPVPTGPGGRYVSKFVTTGSIDNKILNTVIGNKLNAFTALTYNDTRDFIYQILDSGETEFIRDFVEKVFQKATCEELYCALFAKLIAEIAHKYPVIHEEMQRYHNEFIKVFDDIQEMGAQDVKKRQHRMGYGQFISELAGQNALEKEQLIGMVEMVGQKIWVITAEKDKVKTVEEFIDCLTRLSGALKERSPKFFRSVQKELQIKILTNIVALIERKAGERPSLSVKARFGLMDLRDILNA